LRSFPEPDSPEGFRGGFSLVFGLVEIRGGVCSRLHCVALFRLVCCVVEVPMHQGAFNFESVPQECPEESRTLRSSSGKPAEDVQLHE
jgi:hypothetical protein